MCASARGVSPTTSITTRVMRHLLSAERDEAVARPGQLARDAVDERVVVARRVRAARSTCRSRPRGGGSRGAGPPASAASVARSSVLRRVLGAGGPARGSGRATRRRPGSPPASASGRSSTPAHARRRRARASGAGSAARRTRRRRRAPRRLAGRSTSSALETCAFTTRTPASASCASGVVRRPRTDTARWQVSRQRPIQLGREPGQERRPPARPSRSCSPGSGSSASRMRRPVSSRSRRDRRRRCSSARRRGRGVARVVHAVAPAERQRRDAALLDVVGQQARRAAARGRACSAPRVGSAQFGAVDVALDDRRAWNARYGNAVQRHDLEAERVEPLAQRGDRPRSRGERRRGDPEADAEPVDAEPLAHARRVARRAARARRRGRRPGGRWSSTRGAAGCRRDAGASCSSPRSTVLPSKVAREVAVARRQRRRGSAARSGRRTRPGCARRPCRSRRRRSRPRASPATVFGDLERVGDAPVAGRVDEHPLGAVLLEDRDHAVLVHLRVRVDREARPAAGGERPRRPSSSLLWSTTTVLGRRCPTRSTSVERAARARRLVAVRRVHERRQLVLRGQRELRDEAPPPRRRSSRRSRSRRPRRRRPWRGSAAAARAPRGAARRRSPPSG